VSLKKKIGCAVVGLGVGRQHALRFAALEHTSLISVVEHDEKRVQSLRDELQDQSIQHVFFEDVMNDDKIDVVSLASFDGDHYGQIMDSLEAGKKLFIEKPLCQTRAELQNIITCWKKEPRALVSNLVLRKAELYIWLKQLIEKGGLGEVYAFDGDYLYGRMHKILNGWRGEMDGYSVMEGGGIHIIDLMLMLTGQKPKQVHSVTSKVATKDTDFKYHDFQSSTFLFESGLVGRITANFGCVHRHHHVIRVFGTKGTFIYDDAGARIHWNSCEDKIAEKVDKIPLPVNKGVLIAEFIESIDTDTIVTSAYREFDLMSVVLAADEAQDRNKNIAVEYAE
jgi:predicted dehydrogenase